LRKIHFVFFPSHLRGSLCLVRACSASIIARRQDAAYDIRHLVLVERSSALHRFDPNRPFLPRLYRIIHNISVDHLKRNRCIGETIPAMDAHLDASIGPDPSPSPADHAEQAELRRAIWQAVGRLPLSQRSVLMLCYCADQREMTVALRVRPGTVKSWLHRARSREFADIHT
jgi:RNA polymerase sigma factor (sigma-70 family)